MSTEHDAAPAVSDEARRLLGENSHEGHMRPLLFSDENFLRNFWSRVEVGEETECWPWRGATGETYGKITVGGVTYTATRISWCIANDKEWPEGLFACHTCDNPPCVNPLHLWAGSSSENTIDAFKKGRREAAPKAKSNREKSYCDHGHVFTDENTIIKKNGYRQCRACQRRWNSASSAKNRETKNIRQTRWRHAKGERGGQFAAAYLARMPYIPEDRKAVLPCTMTLPTPDMIRARLLRNGWLERPARHLDASIYDLQHQDFEEPINLVLPRGEMIKSEWRSSVEGALRTLAALEDRLDGVPDRPIGDIAAEIIADAAQRGRAAEGGEDD